MDSAFSNAPPSFALMVVSIPARKIYNEAEIDEMIMLIRDSFLPAFTDLEKTLQCKLAEAESDWD